MVVTPIIEKKRILVMDEDLVGVDMDKWKMIMRIVLGRHYDNIQKQGPGWSFPLHTQQVFETHLQNLYEPPPSPPPYIDSTPSIITTTTIATDEKSTSTDTIHLSVDCATQTTMSSPLSRVVVSSSTLKSGGYKYDIDPHLVRFRKQWLQQLHLDNV